MNIKIIILAVLVITISSCGLRNRDVKKEQQDEFYSVFGGWDWVRVPLIKPYELKNNSPKIDGSSWGLKLKTVKWHSTYNVKKVSVEDSVIFVKCGSIGPNDNDKTIIGTRNYPTAWYILDLKKDIESAFNNKNDFNTYCEENSYPIPTWHLVDSLRVRLSEKGKLPWFP
ncbi:MAG: hypothetical protein ACJA0Q_001721 [Saprospiraceae bacterium]|jgi:hypothetical protein